MKKFYGYLFLIFCLWACSESDSNKNKASKVTKADSLTGSSVIPITSDDSKIDDLKDEMTVPPYGLDHVKELIANIKPIEDTDGYSEKMALDKATFLSLPFNQKFTYQMIHPETYSQMCDMLPERHEVSKRIYGQLPNVFGEYEWSEYQLAFFNANHDKVVEIMKNLITRVGHVGSNFKEAIVEMNAKEMIPFLIQVYNKGKTDHYLLTVLMLLMKKNQYPEFVSSQSYKKLYDVQTDEYSAYLNYNSANEDLIIRRAKIFYNDISKK